MTDQLLAALESKLDRLIGACDQLSRENDELRQQVARARVKEDEWLGERKRLIEKNELAKNRVEAMITRLKSLEEHN